MRKKIFLIAILGQLILLIVLPVRCSPSSGGVGVVPENPAELNRTGEYLSKSAVPVPGRSWRVVDEDRSGINPVARERLGRFLFPENTEGTIQTDGVVVVKDGIIVYERYSNGYQVDQPHLTWSVSKGFLGALVGIAVKEGRFDLDRPAYEYYKPLDRGEHRKITARHLLTMTSGLKWNEGYEASPLKSSVLNMLYTKGYRDMALYTANHPVAYEPGTHWYYSSGDSNLLSAVLKGALKEDYSDYPWEKLFSVIGMDRVTWEKDHEGTYVASSYLYATPRDMARFGLLYLNNGRWGRRNLFSPDWVKQSTTMVPGYYSTPMREDMFEDNPGLHLFLNLGDASRNVERPWPDAPADTFAFTGHWGQIIIVIPSRRLVIVRVANDREKSMDKNQFMKLVLSLFAENAESKKGEGQI